VAWNSGTSSLAGLMWGGGIVGPEWVSRGIPPAAAHVWELLGVRPEDAAGYTAAGMDALKVVEEFWRAGIPLDEVSSWLSAGLTADEAAKQRAAGTPSSDAAAFGALRSFGGY
jgi:hypothetical protein